MTLEWKNILNVPLPINNLFLECEIDGHSIDRSLWPLSPYALPVTLLECSAFEVDIVSDCSLDALESRMVLFALFTLG